jgi:hypothetical protein
VVTPEPQPDESNAFSAAVAVVASWRDVWTGRETSRSRVDRARASVRRWELEIAMIRDFHLTLTLETEPLDEPGRADHLRWRVDALEEARRALARAESLPLV